MEKARETGVTVEERALTPELLETLILLSTAAKNWRAILHFYLEELGMEFWSARLYKNSAAAGKAPSDGGAGGNDMTRAEAEARVKAQLALDFNCEPGDFDREENMITPAAALEGRRRFSDKPFFLQMATFGGNAVISADEALHPWLLEWAKGKRGFWLFEQHNYLELDRELLRHGYEMALTHHMFLPLSGKPETDPALPVRWLEQGDLGPWYGREEFSNALCDRFRPERPDVLAVIALDGDAVMGMAGCSADAPGLWQIGVDVLPRFRRRGIGTALVTLLKNEAQRRGAIPYYGTSLSNLASWKTALGAGFGPVWVEAEAREAKERSFAK